MRDISNVGSPLPTGSKVQFLLRDGTGQNPMLRDTVTGEAITSFMTEAVAGADGLFSIEAWENSRGSALSYYQVKVTYRREVLANFQADVPEGEGVLNIWELVPPDSAFAIPVAGIKCQSGEIIFPVIDADGLLDWRVK